MIEPAANGQLQSIEPPSRTSATRTSGVTESNNFLASASDDTAATR